MACVTQLQELKATTAYLKAVHIAVGQHHGCVVLVEGISRDAADESRLSAVGEGKTLSKGIEVLRAHRTHGVL